MKLKTSYDFLTVLRTNSTHCMPTLRSATHLKYVTGLITSLAWLEWPAVLVYLNMTSFPALEVAWIILTKLEKKLVCSDLRSYIKREFNFSVSDNIAS